MPTLLEGWRVAADELWAAKPFPLTAAGKLLAEIRGAGDPQLRKAAEQGLPSIRRANHGASDNFQRTIARNRFGVVRNALHALTGMRFGRQTQPHVFAVTSQAIASTELAHRELLGVSTQGALTRANIQAAYKRMARAAHPDTGGDTEKFYELTRARDALLALGD
jgi:hypothetical protein